jgi:hypothetical protein
MRNIRKGYGQDLQQQIREREVKKLEEKRRKEQEEILEEQRLNKERNLMEVRSKDEERRRREELEKYKLDNERIMNSYMVMSKPKIQRRSDFPEAVKVTEEELRRQLIEKRKREIQFYNESIQNSLEKIKNDLISQQNIILKEVNKLRDQNLHSDLYKIDIHNSLSDIREELKRKKIQENIQKDYLYNSLVETNLKRNKLNSQFNRSEDVNKYPDIYINKSHNLFDLRSKYNSENKYCLNPNILTEKLNREFENDKINLNDLLMKNEKRLQLINRKYRMID